MLILEVECQSQRLVDAKTENTLECIYLFVYLFLPLAEEFGGIPSRKIRV